LHSNYSKGGTNLFQTKQEHAKVTP